MSKNKVFVVALCAAVATSGGAVAHAVQQRDVGTVKATHYPVGNTASSIDEVRVALAHDDIRARVHNNLGQLLSKSEDYATSYEFERDLFVCEQLHPIPFDHEADHPESKPLAACVLQTFETHQVGQS